MFWQLFSARPARGCHEPVCGAAPPAPPGGGTRGHDLGILVRIRVFYARRARGSVSVRCRYGPYNIIARAPNNKSFLTVLEFL